MNVDSRQKVVILRALREAEGSMGSAAIAEAILPFGFEASPRTIRLYLQELEGEGLVAQAKRGRSGGRTITAKGIKEIKDSSVVDRIGFTASKVDTLSWRMDFNSRTRQGRVVLNSTLIKASDLDRALDEMIPVFEAGLGMGEYIALAREGETLGELEVPEGRVAIGSVCGVTLNGVFLNERIPVVSTFGGVLEMQDGEPVRFTDVIYYNGTSLDPLEVFIKGGLTSVRETARSGYGRIGASFRDVPTTALEQARKLSAKLDEMGLGGVLLLGKPNKPVLDFPVHEGRTGIVVAGGLNPASTLEEAGIENENFALSTLYEFDRLIHYKDVQARAQSGDLIAK